MHRPRKQQPDTRLAYQQRVAAQFGALRTALDSGVSIEQAAQQAGMDAIICAMWCRMPRDLWPDAQ